MKKEIYIISQLLIYFALTKKYFSIDKQNTGEIARDGHKI